MNYFVQGLISGNKKYWAIVAAMGVWVVAIIDIISTGISSKGLFNGKWFFATVILTILAPIIYYIFDFTKRVTEKKKMDSVEKFAKAFEPMREQEIRRMIAEDPEFVTLCYECIHFNPNLLACDRRLTEDITKQRVKEIRIKNVVYCLYWKKA